MLESTAEPVDRISHTSQAQGKEDGIQAMLSLVPHRYSINKTV